MAAIDAKRDSALAAFPRASVNDGSKETHEFTEVDRSLSAGFSLKDDRWGRHDDTVGVAAVANGLSSAARDYFAAGGLGILIGEGTVFAFTPSFEALLPTDSVKAALSRERRLTR